MLQNIKNKADLNRIIRIIKSADNKPDITAMCIWGSFDYEVPGIHLGHLHMINTLCGLAMEDIKVYICINEEPDTQNVVKRHTSTTNSILHVLPIKMAEVSIDILIGSKETEKLRMNKARKFNKLQRELYNAHKKILDIFVELCNESTVDKKTKPSRKVKEEICQQLKLKPKDFDDLFELLVIRNKIHARSPWASNFGATLQLMEKKPSFLIVGKRHAYIWTLYNCIFRLAKQDEIPIISVTNFMDCIGKKPMNSQVSEVNIRLDDEQDIMKGKFLKAPNVTRSKPFFALRDTFEKLLFTSNRTVTYKKHKYSSYQELLNATNNQLAIVADIAVKSLNRQFGPLVKIISAILLSDSPYTEDVLKVDNRRILTHISESLPAIAKKVLEVPDSVNQVPQSHREIYNLVFDKAILGNILSPSFIDPQIAKDQCIVAAFDDIKSLIRSTRDMDVLPYQISKRHRDHYYHQINVGGLGAMLLDVHISEEVPLWKHLAKNLNLAGENDEILERKVKAIWWITALLHDHAYALQYAIPYIPNLIALQSYAAKPKVVKKAFQIYQELLRPMMANELAINVFEPLYDGKTEDAREKLKQLVGGWIGSIPTLRPEKISAEDVISMAGNHGVMGAINFLYKIAVNDFEGEWKDTFISIAAAVLVHHLPNKPEVSFIENPLSFLLIFVDEIQEWSRLLLHQGEHKSCLDKIILQPFSSHPEQPSTRRFGDYLEVVFPFSDENILKETGWNRELFHQGKSEGLSRLLLPGSGSDNNFPKIKWLESYPSRARLG